MALKDKRDNRAVQTALGCGILPGSCNRLVPIKKLLKLNQYMNHAIKAKKNKYVHNLNTTKTAIVTSMSQLLLYHLFVAPLKHCHHSWSVCFCILQRVFFCMHFYKLHCDVLINGQQKDKDTGTQFVSSIENSCLSLKHKNEFVFEHQSFRFFLLHPLGLSLSFSHITLLTAGSVIDGTMQIYMSC